MKKISTVGAVNRNTKTPIKPVLDPNRFSTWNKLHLTLATVFNLIYRAKKNRSDKSQYTKDDVCLSQNFLLKLSQNNAFFSTINALKRTQKLDAKSKLRNLNPIRIKTDSYDLVAVSYLLQQNWRSKNVE